jgi:GT2 family glycosyltransferase
MEIVTVNYNTPDLIDNLIGSVREVSSLSIRVIDGSDREETQRLVREVCGDYSNVICEQLGYNIHHGRGMDYALNTTKHDDWVLIIDSDSMIKAGLLEALRYDKPYCGFGMQVNRYGINCEHDILYLHPHFLLVNINHYHTHPFKFIHHGAPAIQIMANTPNEQKNVIDEKYQEFFVRGGRGTVDRFGYNL